MRTLGAALEDAASTAAGVRFVARNEEATFYAYSDIHRRARTMAAALQACGVQTGDVVALILPTSISFYDAFFGAVLLGAIPVALYPPQRLGKMQAYHAQTARCLVASQAVLVVTNRRIHRVLGQAVAQALPALGCVTIEAMVDGASASDIAPQATCAAASSDACAFLQFSSGTTASPKVVALTHRQVHANMQAIAQRLYRDAPLAVGAKHTPVSWLPLYHDMGLVGCMLTALTDATTLTLIEPETFVARPSIWLRTISRYRATISAAPNFAYSLCTARITDDQLDGVDLSCWQVALNGAECVSAQTMTQFAARFAPFGLRPHVLTPVYGLAEAALGVAFAAPRQRACVAHFDADALERLGRAVPDSSGQPHVSVGTPLDGYAVRIVDDAGKALAAGHKGDIEVCGPSVTCSVDAWASAATTSGPGPTPPSVGDASGWLQTGDVGFVSAGQLYVVGRRKDVIIVRGRNIAPQLVEASIDVLPGVRTGCVVAASHRAEGDDTEALLLFVERRRGPQDVSDAQLIQSVQKAALAACQIQPKTVVLCDPGTLLRTSSGKLRRQPTLLAFLTGQLTKPNAVTWWSMGLEVMRSYAAMPRPDSRAP